MHARLDHLTVSLPHPTFTQPVLSHLWQVWSASETCADPVFSRCLWLMKSPRRSQTREPIRLPCFASSCHENSTKAMWKVWEVLESMVKKKADVLPANLMCFPTFLTATFSIPVKSLWIHDVLLILLHCPPHPKHLRHCTNITHSHIQALKSQKQNFSTRGTVGKIPLHSLSLHSRDGEHQ